jgi:hypothetical protein
MNFAKEGVTLLAYVKGIAIIRYRATATDVRLSTDAAPKRTPKGVVK